jgi:uncharacterized protein with PIN domain
LIKVTFHPDAGHPKRLIVAEARCNACNQRLSLAMHADAAVAIEAVAYAATQLCVTCSAVDRAVGES